MKKIKTQTLFISLTVFFLFLATGTAGVAYAFPNNQNSGIIFQWIPLPAVAVDYFSWISFGEVGDNLKSVRNFYENQDFSALEQRIDFSTEDGKKRLKIKEKQIINKMIEDKIVERLLAQKKQKVSDDLVDQAVGRKLREYGSEEAVRKKLQILYGWSLEDFKKKIVRPSLYRDKLKEIFEEETKNDQGGPKAKIEKVKKELESGKSFADVAEIYSEGEGFSKGGDLGWFKKDNLIPKIAQTVFNLDAGQRSEIIETELGYHIIQVSEKNDSEKMVKISQILVYKSLFSAWLEEEMRAMKFNIWHRDYYWNEESLMVEFRDESLRQFEKDFLKNFTEEAILLL